VRQAQVEQQVSEQDGEAVTRSGEPGSPEVLAADGNVEAFLDAMEWAFSQAKARSASY
jgi:hypothetical protein